MNDLMIIMINDMINYYDNNDKWFAAAVSNMI